MTQLANNHFVKTLLFIALAAVWLPMGLVCGGEPKPNVLLICIDDLRPELKSFGADYIHSPNIDVLASKGRAFHRHYVQAPTCGASRYTLLTGNYGPVDNAALFKRSNAIKHPSFPAWFRQNEYTTVSVGKVSHHPGGRGGSDWDDDSKPEMPDSWDQHSIVESIDVFPTVCELAGLTIPDFVDGTSLMPILNDPMAGGGTAISYKSKAETIRTETHRLVLHQGGQVELYDHTSAAGETTNIAENQPEKVAEMIGQLRARLKK